MRQIFFYLRFIIGLLTPAGQAAFEHWAHGNSPRQAQQKPLPPPPKETATRRGKKVSQGEDQACKCDQKKLNTWKASKNLLLPLPNGISMYFHDITCWMSFSQLPLAFQ